MSRRRRPKHLLDALQRLGSRPAGARACAITPLAGGVSSDISRVDVAGPQLLREAGAREAQGRGRLARAGRAQPQRGGMDPRRRRDRPRGRAAADRRGPRDAGLFAMAGSRRSRTRCGRASCATARSIPRVAAEVGRRIVLIHAATAGRVGHRRPLRQRRDLPIDPDRALPARHRPSGIPTARTRCAGSRETTARTKLALVHGDVSPKNILVGPGGPVFLDAECAWYGDPAFDLAFLPQPPAAQMRVAAAMARALSRGLPRRSPRPISPASRGSRATCSRALAHGCSRGFCWRASTGSRRSSTSPGRPIASAMRACAKPLLARPAYPARRGRRGVAAGHGGR